METEELSVSASTIGLLVIIILIPVIGFVMTLSHAKKGETRQEQRWRKSHGLLFWVLIPGIDGALILLSITGILPQIMALVGILSLGLTTFLSWSIQKKREEKV
jgi:uncharacterized membrane protein